MKKTLILILAAFMTLTCFGCNTSNDKGGNTTVIAENDIEFWSVSATEKILQDRLDIYDSLKGDAKISLTAAKGEYESSQIIMTAKNDISSYDVKITDLASENGKNIFKKEDILVYNEKYLNVTDIYENNGAPKGMYPDALLPFSSAKEHNENKIAKNNNQGLYITFNVGIDQSSDIYTGGIEISYGSHTKYIPVKLIVADLTVSEKNNAKSIFLNQWPFQKGELNSSQEMLNAYTEALIEYRLAPDLLVTDSIHSDEDIAFYTELAYTYMQNPRCSNITIPYKTTFIDNEQCIDPDIFDKYLTAFANKSKETNFNMLEKSVCYLGIIDEPQQNGIFNRVKVVNRVYKETLTKTADKIQNDTTFNSPIKSEIVSGIRKLRNVVTSSYESAYTSYIDTWCPQVSHYNSEVERKNYDSQEEKWWYTCVSPRVPNPTYHIEDTLLSARSMSWMQAEYDVVGNLFWATNIYARYDGNKYVDIEDYYETATRFPNVNGDGYLFYAGKKYGLEKPIGSLRLEAIRDGLEEYELLLAMKEQYEEIKKTSGYDFDTSLGIKGLRAAIYTGTTVTATSENFAAARSSLFELARLASSEAKVCVTDYSDDNQGKIVYKIFVKNGFELKNNDVLCSDFVPVTGGKVYSVTTNLNQDKNTMLLSVEINGEKLTYEQYLGGKVIVNSVETADLAKDFTKEGVTPTATLIDAKTLDTALNGKIIKVALPSVSKGKRQSFRLGGALIDNIDDKSKKIILQIYFDAKASDASTQIIISSKNEKSSVYFDLATLKLVDGMNTIEISLASRSWEKTGKISYLALYLGGKNGEIARDIYIKDVVVYNK